jgi:hypothetical protein
MFFKNAVKEIFYFFASPDFFVGQAVFLCWVSLANMILLFNGF